jgi:hypothetical protein
VSRSSGLLSQVAFNAREASGAEKQVIHIIHSPYYYGFLYFIFLLIYLDINSSSSFSRFGIVELAGFCGRSLCLLRVEGWLPGPCAIDPLSSNSEKTACSFRERGC